RCGVGEVANPATTAPRPDPRQNSSELNFAATPANCRITGNSRPTGCADELRPASLFRGSPSSQSPQSPRREYEGKAAQPAERPECPDEEEAAGGPGNLGVMCPPHVDDRHGRREQPDDQHDDVSRSPSSKHQGPVEEDDEDEQRRVRGLRLRYPS